MNENEIRGDDRLEERGRNDLQRQLAAGLFVWAEDVLGPGEWEVVGVADFYQRGSQGTCISRSAVRSRGRVLEIGDDVPDTTCQVAPMGNLTVLFQQRNTFPNNDWYNFKLLVFADGTVKAYYSYEPLDYEDPRQWSDESEFTFGPFEEEPDLRE